VFGVTSANVLAHPFAYWVGMDTDVRTTHEALAEFNHFYSTTHVHEVVAAHPGFVRATRYELVEPDPRGIAHTGPRWLAIYDMADEAAAVRYIKDNQRPWLHRQRYSPWPSARRRAKTVWRMIWRRTSAGGAIDPLADSLLIVGTKEAASGAYVAHFELYREFAHPPPGCPRYCAILNAEAGEPAAGVRNPVWRLIYRRIPPPE
jgi:hypothetical protein